jgi:hypothetical protein
MLILLVRTTMAIPDHSGERPSTINWATVTSATKALDDTMINEIAQTKNERERGEELR